MRSVTYVGVDGSVWHLTASEHEGVFLQASPDELRADDDAMSGSLDLVVADHTSEGRELGELVEVEADWRKAWSVRSFGTLQVEDDRRSPAWVRVKLDGPIAGFPDLDAEGYVEFSQSVVCESATWWRTYQFTGPKVTVVNSGDVDGWVQVRWTQGGTLVLPSGATVALPSVSGPRTIVLDPHESCAVLDDGGNVDTAVWKFLRGKVFPEVVPAGEVRELTIPAGATLIFNEGVSSPW